MPDKPTDKKLTFVEWVTEKRCFTIELNENYGRSLIGLYTKSIITKGTHGEGCVERNVSCELCNLEKLLTDYYKYFKQK